MRYPSTGKEVDTYIAIYILDSYCNGYLFSSYYIVAKIANPVFADMC